MPYQKIIEASDVESGARRERAGGVLLLRSPMVKVEATGIEGIERTIFH